MAHSSWPITAALSLEPGDKGAPAGRAEARLRRLVPWGALLTVILWAPLVWHFDHSWDDADPEVLNNAYRLASGKPLYHSLDGPPWVVSPYPPLYTALTAAGLRLTGLSYAPARAISFLATIALAAALMLVSRRATGRARDGLWSLCLLLLVPAFLYNFARPHPQMLAVALSLWSFLLFDSRRWVVADILSPLLAVLAVYTKQTQIALPLALGFWLLLRDRRRLLRYSAAVAGFGLVPAALLQAATHGAFLPSMFGLNLLPYTTWQIAPVLIHQAGPLGLFIGLAVARLASRLRRGAALPVDFYLVSVLLFTVPSLGRVGAHGQYVLEMLVLTVVYLLSTGGLAFPAGRRALTSAQIAVLLLYAPLFVLLEEGPFDRASLKAAPAIRALLASEPGPILSQQGSFPLFTRGEIHVQLFHFTSLARMGAWNPRPLLREIEQRQLAWVLTESPLEEPLQGDTDRERFTPELHDALARNYVRRAALGPYYIYRPRLP